MRASLFLKIAEQLMAQKCPTLLPRSSLLPVAKGPNVCETDLVTGGTSLPAICQQCRMLQSLSFALSPRLYPRYLLEHNRGSHENGVTDRSSRNCTFFNSLSSSPYMRYRKQSNQRTVLRIYATDKGRSLNSSRSTKCLGTNFPGSYNLTAPSYRS